MMDDNDFDHIIDVPDTPDRLSARLRSHTTGKECNSGCQSLLKDEVRGVDRIGPSRRPFIRPPKRITSANGSVGCSNTIILSPSDNPCNSQGHSRRMKTDESSEHDSGCISAALYDIHHGKALRSSDASEDGAAMGRNACKALHETSSPFRTSKQFGGKCRKAEGETNRDYSHHPSNSFQRLASNSGKGKEKVDESICRGNGSAMGHGKEIHLPGVSFNNNNERNLPKRSLEPHDVSSPRAVRQKKLVRNGCISPHNIATKTIHLDGENSNNLKNFGPIVLDDVSGSSQCWPEEKGLTGDGNGGRDKGKGILHPCSSRDHGARAINTSSRNPFITGTDAARRADANVEDFNESQSGWRSTRNNRNNMVHASSTVQASHQRIGSLTGSSIMTRKDVPERTNRLCLNKSSRSDVPQNIEAERATSRLAPSASTAVRRQTRNGLRSRNDVDHDSVVLLEDSPDLPSARRPNHRSNPIIEIDEFSPVVRQSGSERAGPSVPNHLDDATARQMEADEILARELQEQLYNESLSTEFVAQILHEDQNHVAPTNAVGHRRTSVNRGASTTRTRRQPQPQLRQGRSPFRGRINAAIRSQQTRGRRQTSRRPSTLARDTGPRFPSNMDLDMRIDVLEALEAALGDMDDIIEATSDIFHMQRDFNEDDYEMLLALDENVHQAGASSRQINNLPESKVQNNTMCEETCAICLENPAIGDTIRHLPCFHKFHKDCIDPWLSRSTSCPVCKSSIS